MLAPTTISLRIAREKRRKDREETQRAFQLVTLMRTATLLQRNASRLFHPLEFAIPTCITSKLRCVFIFLLLLGVFLWIQHRKKSQSRAFVPRENNATDNAAAMDSRRNSLRSRSTKSILEEGLSWSWIRLANKKSKGTNLSCKFDFLQWCVRVKKIQRIIQNLRKYYTCNTCYYFYIQKFFI